MYELLEAYLSRCGVWGVVLTLGAFGLGTFVNRKTGKGWCNPLLLGSLFVILLLSLLRVPYAEYRTSAEPVSYLLLPATVSLAIPLYEKWQLLKENTAAIFAGIFAGVATSLGSVVLLAWLLKLEFFQAVTLLPKSVTTAIGMDVAAALGGMAPLAGAVIILTGIMGGISAQWLCGFLNITDPLAKGIAIGTASHAIGTAKALEMGEIEGAMSGLAIAVAGILTAVLAPVFAGLLP
ncbi:MAG: LrgB family protein [Oscillibacter sp.]|jgi:putative effector of murein hydrolase|nr:LrgB family protein [Oscillibacter sp.]MCI9374972.1 LrgB family protein [Oscillibacter sp.]